MKCSSDWRPSSPLKAEQEIKMQEWKLVCLSLCVRLSIIAMKWHITTTYRRAARGERCVFKLSLRVIHCNVLWVKTRNGKFQISKMKGFDRVFKDRLICPSIIPPKQRHLFRKRGSIIISISRTQYIPTRWSITYYHPCTSSELTFCVCCQATTLN